MALVDEHGGKTGLLVHVRRQPADVPAVAHREERQQRDERVLGGMECGDQRRHAVDALEQRVVGREPDALGLEGHFRKLERRRVDHASVCDRLALVADHLLANGDPSHLQLDAGDDPRAQRLDDRGLRLLARLRVPVDRDRAHERRARLEVERRDAVLLSQVEVHRALVDRGERALALGRPEDGAALLVDDHEGLGVARAKRDTRCRGVAPAPDEAGRGGLELGQGGSALERLGPENRGVRLGERSLVGRCEHVRIENARRRVVDQRCLGSPFEQGSGLIHEELVEPILAGDEHCEARLAPAGPAPLLPE